MPDGGTLTVSTQGIMIDEEFKTVHGYGHSGKYALITVEDTGHGIAAETQEKIFEPFFTTKEVGKGSGLGLAIVYGIVKQHKGYIDVYSEEGKGTSFKIYLPSIDFVHEESAMKERPPMVGGTETILLTEDESLLRAATKAMLEKMGYCVLEAADGEQAVRVFMENKDVIDIMVMDVIMPAKGGLDAYKEIAVIKPYVKVIFMSGYAGDTIAKNIIEEGLELMQKPVLPMELLYKIRTILDMGKRKP
jgi:CheY-like chemotaxis protein